MGTEIPASLAAAITERGGFSAGKESPLISIGNPSFQILLVELFALVLVWLESKCRTWDMSN